MLRARGQGGSPRDDAPRRRPAPGAARLALRSAARRDARGRLGAGRAVEERRPARAAALRSLSARPADRPFCPRAPRVARVPSPARVPGPRSSPRQPSPRLPGGGSALGAVDLGTIRAYLKALAPAYLKVLNSGLTLINIGDDSIHIA